MALSMQRCWGLREIVDLIADSLTTPPRYGPWSCDEPHFTTIDRKALAALARTSRVAHASAIRVLWTYQDGLHNLVRCLPQSSWKMIPMSGGVYTELRITRTLQPDEWSRFDEHAAHVKELTFWSNKYRLTAGLLQDLRTARSVQLLLPHLRVLNWDDDRILDGQKTCPFWEMFVGPCAEIIHLGNEPLALSEVKSSETVHNVIARLHELAAPVRELKSAVFYLPGWRDALRTATTQFQSLASLRLLIFTPLPENFWKNLSTLPLLTHICLEAVNSSCWSQTTKVANSFRPQLEALEQLHISLDTGEEAISIIESNSFTKLRELHVIVPGPSMHDLLRTIHDHIPHKTLHRLYVRDTNGTFSDYPFHIHDESSACWSFLHPFRNLVELQLDLISAPDLDVVALSDLAHALPCLQRLRIASSVYRAFVPLEALSILVERCPRLDELWLDLDAAEPHTVLPIHRCTNDTITKLIGGGNVVANPPEVSAFLSCLFPNLRTLSLGSDDESESSWEKVEALLKAR